MRISLSDRYEALRRHRGYCKDWEAWQQTSDTGSECEFEDATKRLKAKYRIPRIPTPLKYSRHERIQNEPRAIEVIPSLKSEEDVPNIWCNISETFFISRPHKIKSPAFRDGLFSSLLLFSDDLY